MGEAMMEQARMRADEIGAVLLWCDGGGSDQLGVSGVVGNGEQGSQVGRGTLVRNVGAPWSDNVFERERQTWYAWGGNGMTFTVLWGVFIGAWCNVWAQENDGWRSFGSIALKGAEHALGTTRTASS